MGAAPALEASRRQREELADRFFAAIGDGNLDGLLELLAQDAAVYGDGGGRAPSWPRPIVGRERVAKLLAGVGKQGRELGVSIRRAEINGQPGAMFFDPDGRLINVVALEIAGGLVQTVRSIVNPDKLRHLGPLADVRGLVHGPQLLGRLSQQRLVPRLGGVTVPATTADVSVAVGCALALLAPAVALTWLVLERPGVEEDVLRKEDE